GSQAREVVMTLNEYEQIREQMERDAEAGYKDMAEEEEGTSEPAYIVEGQRGYAAIEEEDEEE
ncbi:MAG: hypothetical protein ACYTEQ_28985, partial [Planctomycetota bacterium]